MTFLLGGVLSIFIFIFIFSIILQHINAMTLDRPTTVDTAARTKKRTS